MDESEEKMNFDKLIIENVHMEKDKPRKRSLVERELETSLTPRVTAPLANGEGASTSRYGRARRSKNKTDFYDTEKSVTNYLNSPDGQKLPVSSSPTSPVYKMQASNSLIHESLPKKVVEINLESQIEQIYNSNISLSRFGPEEKKGQQSPAKKFPIVYVRKDIIQSKEKENPDNFSENINIDSPARSANKSNSHLENILERSSEKYDLNSKPQNGYLDNLSVVKTLDFDCSKKKRKETKETKSTVSKTDLFESEAKCQYQVGDIAWARIGTFPFWPCIVTREPGSDMFVRKKLFGKLVERDIIHVTFFGDNGRRSWVLNSMLRKFLGLAEFEATRDQFTPEAKKKDPKLYAAFFISDKKLSLWHTAIEEADVVLREPKRLRIDVLNDFLGHQTIKHTPLKIQKSGKVTRTNSDVSLSESLYDSLFSENDSKLIETGYKKCKSLDVSEVVTACLDNMAAKTGMTMIQRQSHMDIWLQKAKSKTPEKLNISVTVERIESEQKSKSKERYTKSKSKESDNNSSKKKKRSLPQKETPIKKPYSFRKSTESQNLFPYHNEHNYSKQIDTLDTNEEEFESETESKTSNTDDIQPDLLHDDVVQCDNDICVIDKVESLCPLQAQNDIQEEVFTDHEDLLQIEGVPVDTTTKVVINQPEAMDVDESDCLNKDIEQSKEVEQLPDKIIGTEHSSKSEAPVTKNEQTVAFITETNTQNSKNTVSKQKDGRKRRTRSSNNKSIDNVTDCDKDQSLQNMNTALTVAFIKETNAQNSKSTVSKQKDGRERRTRSSNNMSIDNVTDYDKDQSLKNINTAFDNVDKHKSSKVDGIEQQEPTKPEEDKSIETQHNPTPMDMSVDDVTDGCQHKSLETDLGLSNELNYDIIKENEFAEKPSINTEIPNISVEDITDRCQEKSLETDFCLSNEFKRDIIKTNQFSEKPSKKTERPKLNNLEISTKSVDTVETKVPLTTTEKEYEISLQTPVLDSEPVNTSEKIPIVKLTVIKEASLNSFKKAQANLEPTTPKRRSSRRPKPKKLKEYKPMEEPEFLQYLEMRQDAVIDEHPELSQDEIVAYLYKTWQFSLRKSNSPATAHDETDDTSKTPPTPRDNKSGKDVNKPKADVKVSQPKLENCWNLNKRSFRLHKSLSPPSVSKSDGVETSPKNNLTGIKDNNSKDDTQFFVTQSETERKTLTECSVPLSFIPDSKTTIDSMIVTENNIADKVQGIQLNSETKHLKNRSLRICISKSRSRFNTLTISHDISPESETKELVSQASLEANKINELDTQLRNSQSPSESLAVLQDNNCTVRLTEMKEDQLKTFTQALEKPSHKDESQLYKSQSPLSLITETADVELKEDNSKRSGLKNVLLQPKLETKRSLRLRKLQSPSGSKKTEDNLIQGNMKLKTAKISDSQLLLESKVSLENEEKNIIQNVCSKIKIETGLGSEIPEENKVTSYEDNNMYVVKSDKRSLRLRISKAIFEPKVVLERKKAICEDKNTNPEFISDDRPPVQKKIQTISGAETENIQPSLDIIPQTILDEFNSNSETKKSLRVEQKDDVQSVDSKAVKTKTDIQTVCETVLEDKMPEINGAASEAKVESEVSHSNRRSLRLRRSQSPAKSTEHKQEHNDQSVDDKIFDITSETKNNVNEKSTEGEIRSSNISLKESSDVIKVSVENDCNKTNYITKSENISLSSDLTNGFVDHSSDKDFDPDTVSVSSMTSEISNVSEILPRVIKPKPVSEKIYILQKKLESDSESVSSLDDIKLSEFKSRSKKEKTHKQKHILEYSMDSVRSGSDKRLHLVLSDCVLDAKDGNLPVIKDVRSEANEELEIFESNTETNTCSILGLNDESKVNVYNHSKSKSPDRHGIVKVEMLVPDPDAISIKSSGSETSIKRRGKNKPEYKQMEEPEFLQYLEMKQDALLDEHPEVTPSEVAVYLYKTWQYEESLKSDIRKNEDVDTSNLVKGSNHVVKEPPKQKKAQKRRKLINIAKVMKKSPKKEITSIMNESEHRELPKRKASKAHYREDFSDIEDEIQMFEIFSCQKKQTLAKNDKPTSTAATAPESVEVKLDSDTKDATNVLTEKVVKENEIATASKEDKDSVIILDDAEEQQEEYYDQEELYFEQLTNPKPNVFKGLLREKVCEICEKTSNLVKCKGCSGMFHIECVKKEDEIIDTPVPTRGRKKKKKPRGRKPKSSIDSNEESHSDDKSQDLNVSEENMQVDEVKDVPIVIPDADNFESQLEAKMKEIIDTVDKIDYDSYTSDDGIDWADAIAGKCEIVDVKPKSRLQSENIDDFKCKNCQKDDTPICFVCKSPVSPRNNVESRQKCHVAHCHKYYHLECLEHWPQTQFNAGEPSKNNKKMDEHFEAIACPRHVCHTCVCDDPRGCKTRFSGDKLARCVRCPATYHSFTKCLPAGSQILSASHIVCPRHYEHRPGKVPFHVNTGWCFICALGGNLICCDYCPTSFHADCLNIEPPEGGYMCEDCETGRLPLYGEMVWVKLGHYRWWPGIVLHPTEIPDNILAVKHSPGEFVVRFFGQYDHYWVNRGRVFPFQEGDSGRISTQRSKIDEAFTVAMEHAKRAFEILKNVELNDEENQDIQSSLLPPHYVKLKVNKPCGALYGKKVDIEESSLTQCECNPNEEDPCGPYTHCLNRMLLTECGPICRAGERCQNRAFEKRQYPKLVPYRTPHRGWGLKTLEPIKAGQFVIEYVGELIDEAEFRRRMQRKHEIRDENFYFLTLDKERLIDAGPKGNLARFMNHCCEPNCETQKWTVLGDVRVGLFAIRDIPANTEVTFNYNLECTGIEKKQCMCGAKRCAGYIGAKPKQDEPQPKKLKVAAKRTYKKRKNTTESSPSTQNKPKRPVGRPAKPRELTDIEKDLLIIKNATNGISSDSECSRLSSADEKNTAKALKRKRVSFSTEENVVENSCSSPSVKKVKLDENVEKSSEVGD